MTSQSWIELVGIYLLCWGLGRMCAGADAREEMGTRTLTDKMKLILFLPPKTKLQTFTLQTIIYMAIINGILSVQLILAAINFFVSSCKLVGIIDKLGAYMAIIMFAYMCVTICAFSVHGFKQWKQKRKLRAEIKEKGGLFFDKDDSIEVPEHFVVKIPKWVLYIGLGGILFWLIIITLMTIFPNDTAVWWVHVIFGILLFISLWLTYATIRWKLTVDHDSIRIRNLIGKDKIYSVHEITSAVFKNQGQVLVVYRDSKKIFDLAPYFVGFVTFAGYLQNAGIPIEIKV